MSGLHGSVRTRHPSGAAVVVHAPATYGAERGYIFDLVLGERLGLAWQLRADERSDVRITLKGDEAAGTIVLPDVLFATQPGDCMIACSNGFQANRFFSTWMPSNPA